MNASSGFGFKLYIDQYGVDASVHAAMKADAC
jgi:hypothetical protein